MIKKRPITVRAATFLLIIAYTVQSGWTVIKFDFSDPLTYMLGFPVILVSWFILFMVFHGRNWARWLYLGLLIFSWACFFLEPLRRISPIDALLDGSELIAAFLCFTPSSNTWFASLLRHNSRT